MGLAALGLAAGCSGGPGVAARPHPDRARDVPSEARDVWDERYATAEYVYGKEPAEYLRSRRHLLPAGGEALDVAAGEGRNAVWLAEQGYTVNAVDISPVGLAKARALAEGRGVAISTIEADLAAWDPGEARYDLVVVFYYLQRDLVPRLQAALRPGGVIVFETYTTDNLAIPASYGPRNPDYLLRPGELRALFEGFQVLDHLETRDERKAVDSLVARKPGGP
ncbi:MAG: methyltransferase domain-containing protein [Planctomycetes bacterium]|nr:methyltransferase domain-containing protein [Planctomycetota bacterium]